MYQGVWGACPQQAVKSLFTSVFKHFSFQGFLHLRNPQKPAETNKNQETRKFGNLRNLPKTTVSSPVILLYIVP
jgi:hypothetical protein